MKAKIRKTGEIVDVIAYKSSESWPENDWVCYVDSEGLEHTQKINALRDLKVIEDITGSRGIGSGEPDRIPVIHDKHSGADVEDHDKRFR